MHKLKFNTTTIKKPYPEQIQSHSTFSQNPNFKKNKKKKQLFNKIHPKQKKGSMKKTRFLMFIVQSSTKGKNQYS